MGIKHLKRYYILYIVLIFTIFLNGCEQGIDVSALLPDPVPTTVPQMVNSNEPYFTPPEANVSSDYYIDIYPSQGDSLRIMDPALLGALLKVQEDAAVDGGIHDGGTGCPMGNKIIIRNHNNEHIATFQLASDGCKYAKREDGSIIELSDYVYYSLENDLWQQQGSLLDKPLVWNPNDGTGALDLRMEHYLKTIAQGGYGYCDKYFVTYDIYKTTVDTSLVKVYAIVGFAGYNFENDQFTRKFAKVVPIALNFNKIKSNTWQLTLYRQADDVTSKDSVRTVTPYEDMEDVLSKLKNSDDYLVVLSRQATEYLAANGYKDISVNDG